MTPADWSADEQTFEGQCLAMTLSHDQRRTDQLTNSFGERFTISAGNASRTLAVFSHVMILHACSTRSLNAPHVGHAYASGSLLGSNVHCWLSTACMQACSLHHSVGWLITVCTVIVACAAKLVRQVLPGCSTRCSAIPWPAPFASGPTLQATWFKQTKYIYIR